jgi:predicted RNA-binding Zn-ribbon protein involved in translation (DUF1610 family)
MNKTNTALETIGLRYTGRAALNRDPQLDRVEFTCPRCGAHGDKPARRPRASYHFTDGFVQDLQGESTVCRSCRKALHVTPVVLVHDQHEKLRFDAVFEADLNVSKN